MIYFLRTDGFDAVKIGFTEDHDTLERRMRALQTGVPWKLDLLRLIPEGTRWMEAWFHRGFKWAHTHGEWFVYSPDMLTAYPPADSFELRAHKRATAREQISDIIERLVDLLDYLTPDVDVEADKANWEPEGDMYLAVKSPIEALKITWDDCDPEESEASDWDLPADDFCWARVGCDAATYDPNRNMILDPFERPKDERE